jgi:hypothetical protein
VKFDMGADTLTTLTSQTSGQHQDLGSLIKALVVAAEPLEKTFSGPGRVAFDGFKAHTDQITASLNSSLASIIGGQKGMNASFNQGQQDFVQNTKTAQGGADFSAASFGKSA